MPIGLGTAVAIGAGVTGAATLASGAIGANAAGNAANLSKQASDQSLAFQQQQYGDTKANNAPFLQTGTSALNTLAGLYNLNSDGSAASTNTNLDPNSTFYQTPDYQFALGQGIKGVDAGAAATGSLDSGETRKAEIGYAGNLASGQFNNYATRLQSLAGIGQAAANSQAASGLGYSNAYTNTVTNAANTQANAGLAGASATGSSLNSIAGLLQNQLAGQTFASSYGNVTAPSYSLPAGTGSGNFSPLYPGNGPI